ncbi:methylated-DNA--[protein]-cysteine S-methyltransferase [Tsukamurella asaccharolytica]|uniref:Methylated-DNA--[protein]-cysteine S-methyltransferase n=1 Tax=Tsukamurella asaccharolytica TaxID=2592067 RepID=A0A5C5R5Y0_9ACTN|nr:methylated-DNA--[protein]-cysteine S-methyltransferase [Tsukamurella asaccharolytica]TWS17733.1 methylated-DNA--[protein]-cysteine S-methyltransferase [Tsukamurella asaccharolytica]
MTAHYATTATPAGPFTAVVDTDGAVLASGWTADLGDLLPVIHSTLRPTAVEERAELGAVTRAVADFHVGELTAIDDIVVRQRSGPFVEHAWDVLRTVEPGKPLTYTEYADLSGRPAAVRAAAMACARNAAALFVPCHRVLRLDKSLGGFRWGLGVKEWLLAHEAHTIAS